MKNYLLGLLMLCLPLQVMAQSSQQSITEMLYQSASDIFPIICKKELPEAIDYVKQCYKNAGSDKTKLENCLITDRYVVEIIAHSAGAKISSDQMIKDIEQLRGPLTKMYSDNIITYFYNYENRYLSNFPIINKNKHYKSITYTVFLENLFKIFARQIDAHYSEVKSKKEHCIENVFSKNNVFYSYPSDFLVNEPIYKR